MWRCLVFRLLILFLLLIPFKAFAEDIDIIDYIVEHSPKIKVQRALQGMHVKIEGKASAFVGALGDTTDKGAIGITISVPLLDSREKREGQREIALAEESLRQNASQLLLSIRESQAEMRDMSDALKVKYAHLEWMRKRVEAGVDYQKEYHKEHEAYMNMLRAYEQAKAKSAGYMTSLLSLVEKSARTGLKSMLERSE
jgi:hypothetical protein